MLRTKAIIFSLLVVMVYSSKLMERKKILNLNQMILNDHDSRRSGDTKGGTSGGSGSDSKSGSGSDSKSGGSAAKTG